MEVKVSIDQFEGPLDLLLTLISRSKINILDIPIADITEQYNAVIKSWAEFDMGAASEYIFMAARLLQIKSRMLLPKPRIEEEEEDPRAELAAQLAQYSVFVHIGQFLEARERATGSELSRDPEYIQGIEDTTVPVFELRMLERTMRGLTEQLFGIPEEKVEHIVLDEYTVEEKKVLIQKRLTQSSGSLVFSSLFGIHAVAQEVVVTLMALLELYKTGSLDFEQLGEGHEIRIFQ